MEFNKDQTIFESFPKYRKKSEHAFYGERFTSNQEVMLYEQKRSVKGVQNPPKGKLSVKNNRAEGYADYKPGMYYISTSQLTSETVEANAHAAKIARLRTKLSMVRQNRAYNKRRYHYKKNARPMEDIFETAIAAPTTWWL